SPDWSSDVCSSDLIRDLSGAVSRIRRLWDLDADPQAVLDCLSADPALAPWLSAAPGIRVPGAVDGPELVLRALFEQGMSTRRAHIALGRLVTELGTPIAPELLDATDEPTLLFPGPTAADQHVASILPGPQDRVDTIRTVAAALAQ